MMVGPCGGCGENVGYAFGAQYCHNEQHKIICPICYHEKQMRCWFDGKTLTVSVEQPPNSKPAVLYWDEGLWTTGADPETVEITYPSRSQPEWTGDKECPESQTRT